MATHSSILAWRIPWTEEPVGYSPLGSQRVGHNWSDLARAHAQCALKMCFSSNASPGCRSLFCVTSSSVSPSPKILQYNSQVLPIAD